MKASAEPEPSKSNGAWIEAVVEKGSQPRVPTGALRIYFAGGAYCQISSAAEAAWLRSCLDGWVQSDDQLQREPEDIFVGRLLVI
jgi:hypothetical protein